MLDALKAAGFERIIVLDGEECDCHDAGSVVLALWPYEAEIIPCDVQAWIHPYYFVSQRAYVAARAFADVHKAQGVALRDDIRLKPIFARMPGFSQGRNTLSYVEGYGSRFHVQTLTVQNRIAPTHRLDDTAHELHCGACRRCVDACPANALEGGVFHRERCLRNWMMSGQCVPLELRRQMGSMLIGCDICQLVCPHNAPPGEGRSGDVELRQLLTDPKEASVALRARIGVNLSIPNRVLSQACLLAGCSGDEALLEVLTSLSAHPSPTVAAHAAWAIDEIHVPHV